MMNRRYFLRSLAVATAGLYLRLAPTSIKAMPVAEKPAVPISKDDSIRSISFVGGQRYYKYHGQLITAEQAIAVVSKNGPYIGRRLPYAALASRPL